MQQEARTRNHRSLVRRTSDVLETNCSPIETIYEFVSNPSPRCGNVLGICMFDCTRVTRLTLTHPVCRIDDNIGRTMVKHLYHLGFVQRKKMLFALTPLIAAKFEGLFFKPFRVAELLRIVRLVKHCLQRDTPSVPRLLPCLIDQHRHAAIDGFGVHGVPAGAEDWARSRIRVQQLDVLAVESDVRGLSFQVFNGLGKENEVRCLVLHFFAAEVENTEFESPVDFRKKFLRLVLEVKESNEAIALGDFSEEGFGSVVASDTGGDQQSHAAVRGDKLGREFRKDGVQADVSAACQRVVARIAAMVE